jgi:hypothetical protein
MKTFSYTNPITEGQAKSRESKNRVYVRDWIVISGSIINTTTKGGFEFFGPFTEIEANCYREELLTEGGANEVTICVQLLKCPNQFGEHWNPRQAPRYYDEVLES